MTDKIIRCAICDWPISERTEDGCTLLSCSFRPAHGSDDHRRIERRREDLQSLATRYGLDPTRSHHLFALGVILRERGSVHPSVIAEEEAAGAVSVEEAREALDRLVSAAFGRGRARISIPVNPRRDDDIRLAAFIAQSERVPRSTSAASASQVEQALALVARGTESEPAQVLAAEVLRLREPGWHLREVLDALGQQGGVWAHCMREIAELKRDALAWRVERAEIEADLKSADDWIAEAARIRALPESERAAAIEDARSRGVFEPDEADPLKDAEEIRRSAAAMPAFVRAVEQRIAAEKDAYQEHELRVTLQARVEEVTRLAVEAEREACAALCDAYAEDMERLARPLYAGGYDMMHRGTVGQAQAAHSLAHEIRARGGVGVPADAAPSVEEIEREHQEMLASGEITQAEVDTASARFRRRLDRQHPDFTPAVALLMREVLIEKLWRNRDRWDREHPAKSLGLRTISATPIVERATSDLMQRSPAELRSIAALVLDEIERPTPEDRRVMAEAGGIAERDLPIGAAEAAAEIRRREEAEDPDA